MKWFKPLSALLLFAAGCVTPHRPPLTPSALVAMTQAGLTDAEIMQRLAETRTVFYLTASDVARLRQAGVSEPVLADIRSTYLRVTTAEKRRADVEEEEWQQRFGPW